MALQVKQVKKASKTNANKSQEESKRSDTAGNNNQDEDQTDYSKICKLCNREFPLYFYQQEDIILRLPDRQLTKLTLQMKNDLVNKLAYLKYLRINGRFCEPCDCPKKRVHTYCQTA